MARAAKGQAAAYACLSASSRSHSAGLVGKTSASKRRLSIIAISGVIGLGGHVRATARDQPGTAAEPQQTTRVLPTSPS